MPETKHTPGPVHFGSYYDGAACVPPGYGGRPSVNSARLVTHERDAVTCEACRAAIAKAEGRS